MLLAMKVFQRAPQNIDKKVLVGKVRQAHGLRGELYLLLFAGQADWLESKPRQLFFLHPDQVVQDQGSSHGHSVPWLEVQIERLTPHKQGLILKSSESKDRTAAEALKGYFVYVPEELLIGAPGDTPFLHELLDVEVTVSGSPGSGRVWGFSSNGAQDLLCVEWSDGRRLEVPFVEAYVEAMDLTEKKLALNLPEGFFELAEGAQRKSQKTGGAQ